MQPGQTLFRLTVTEIRRCHFYSYKNYIIISFSHKQLVLVTAPVSTGAIFMPCAWHDLFVFY